MGFLIRPVLLLLDVLWWLIIIDAFLSFVPGTARHPLVAMLRRITSPMLAPVRRVFPPRRVGDSYIDFTPLIALLAISVIKMALTAAFVGLVPGRH